MISIKYLESSAIIVREFVPFEMAQIPTILFSIGWTNHQIIMNLAKVITNVCSTFCLRKKNNYRTSN